MGGGGGGGRGGGGGGAGKGEGGLVALLIFGMWLVYCLS